MADQEDPPPASKWRGLVILALIAVLIAGSLFMVRQLRQASALQDCVASGRTNCAPVSTN